jgi:lipopolysaccharide export system protein LptC
MNAQPPRNTPSTDAQRDIDREAVWQPRQTEVAQSVAQYSRFVAAMKVALPVAAGLLLLLVVLLPQLRKDDERFRIGMNLIKGSNTDSLSMTNARYFGTDDKGQPYSVTADGVRQHANDDRAIDLVTPKAEISLTNGTFMSAAASAGNYDRDNQKLDLSGDVTVTQDKGNHLRTSQASVMLKEGTASGRAPVSGDGPFGKMEAAGGFDLSERGKIVHFHGPAKLTLNPKNTAKSDAETANPDASSPAPAAAAPAAAETAAEPKAIPKP